MAADGVGPIDIKTEKENDESNWTTIENQSFHDYDRIDLTTYPFWVKCNHKFMSYVFMGSSARGISTKKLTSFSSEFIGLP